MIDHFFRIFILGLMLIGTIACTKPSTAPATPVLGPSAPVLQGFQDVTDCNVISGWARNINKPDNPVTVDIFDGDALIATLPAKNFRRDLLDAGIGNGQCGFSYAIPAILKDGRPHTIQVKFSGSNILLSTSPKTLTCPAAK